MHGETAALLVYNYRYAQGGHSWEKVPSSLWSSLLTNLDVLSIDGCGFQDVTPTDETRLPRIFMGAWQVVGTASYSPYHGSSAEVVRVFSLTRELLDFISQTSFDEWNRVNDEMPIDELLFFTGTEIRIQAMNLIYFYALTSSELRRLVSISDLFRGNLYTPDMSRPLA